MHKEKAPKKKKWARSHAETIRTCTSLLQLVIGCITLLRVFGKA